MSVNNRRPEHICPPQQYYDENESKKYTKNSRIVKIQAELAERAYELLDLEEDKNCFLLDIGCGSGLSGEILTDNGHLWIGIDIKIAKEKNETEGDLILGDIGCGLPFLPGTFDAKRGARAVFQFYPESQSQSDLICGQARRAGFRGGLVVDYPDVKKKTKVFLVINAGGTQVISKCVGGNADNEDSVMELDQITNSSRGNGIKNFENYKTKNKLRTTRQIIEAKKERQRQRGKDVKACTKYSGRKRRRH